MDVFREDVFRAQGARHCQHRDLSSASPTVLLSLLCAGVGEEVLRTGRLGLSGVPNRYGARFRMHWTTDLGVVVRFPDASGTIEVFPRTSGVLVLRVVSTRRRRRLPRSAPRTPVSDGESVTLDHGRTVIRLFVTSA